MNRPEPFRVYPSQMIHSGHPRYRERNADDTWYWTSLCGRELIGRALEREPEDWERTCKRCAKVWETAEKALRKVAGG